MASSVGLIISYIRPLVPVKLLTKSGNSLSKDLFPYNFISLVFLSKSATLNGELFAKGGVSFFTDSKANAEEKIERFDKDTDIVDEVKDMLE